MSMIHHDKTCPFDFQDWSQYNIEKLYAGNECVMAITAEGEVLQKVQRAEYAARTIYWKNIQSIAISQFWTALAVGLVSDGTCMVSKRALRECCCEATRRRRFEDINAWLKELRDTVKIVVSDAIFALDKYGKVHHISLWREDAYRSVDSWENVKHIVTGNQELVFGITDEGTVLCAGANVLRGPHGNWQEKLSVFHDVIDICAMGSEGEVILLALSDGRIVDLQGTVLENEHIGKTPVFTGNLDVSMAKMRNGKFKLLPYGAGNQEALSSVSSAREVAVGSLGAGYPAFVVWR